MCDKLLPDCAKIFGGIMRGQDAIQTNLASVQKNQTKLFEALFGNGDPSRSIASRLTKIETQFAEGRAHGDRFWKVASVVIAIIAVVIACFK